VRAEVREALRSADRLHDLGRRLHFDHDPQTGALTIELRELEGGTLRPVRPSELFGFASGETVG
jgi:hypothetical protein